MATLPMSSSSKSTQPFLRIEQAPDTLSNGWVLPRKHHNIDTADPRDNTFIRLRGDSMVIRYNYIVRSRFEGMFQYKNIQHCGTGEMPFLLMPTSGWNGLFDLGLLWLSLSLCSQDQSKVFLAQYLHCLISWSQSQPLRIFEALYRVTHLVGENLPLTQFQQFRQLVGRDCSYLLHRQV